MLMVIDEGSSFEDTWGDDFAVPSTSEKGYLDVKFTVGYVFVYMLCPLQKH